MSFYKKKSTAKVSQKIQRLGPQPLILPDRNHRTEPVQRARNYIAKIPGAVAGARGHDQTFQVANILVDKFGLLYDEAIDLLLDYNNRCDPEWSIAELNHKLIDALGQHGKKIPSKLRTNECSPEINPLASNLSKPKLYSTLPFTMHDIVALSILRRIPPYGIKLAADRGFLIKTVWHDHTCFGVRDNSGNLIELRRFDGEMFPASHGLPKRKSHAIRGSNKSWPLGIIESAPYPAIAIVEGIPDFLYAHYRVCEENARDRVAVVAMLSATPLIDGTALRYFANKTVRIFPHLDAAGLHGAKRWSEQLIQAGAAYVDFYNLSGLKKRDGQPVSDLCDLTWLSPEDKNTKIKGLLR